VIVLAFKVAFQNEPFLRLLYCSKSKYVKRGIDVVPVKFGPNLPLLFMQVTLRNFNALHYFFTVPLPQMCNFCDNTLGAADPFHDTVCIVGLSC